MANFETVFSHTDLNLVRVIATAMRAHGIDVRDVDSISFPGVGGKDGFSIQVPPEQTQDASLLAQNLFEEMRS